MGYDSEKNTFSVQLFDSHRKLLKRTPTCEAGDEINGTVILKCEAEFQCTAILVSLEGIASVKYDIPHQGSHKKREHILNHDWATTYVFGNRENKELLTVTAKEYVFPFCIPIKKINPLSGVFTGPFGKIEHRIAARINTPPDEDDWVVIKHIVLNSYLNIRALPEIMKPVVVDYPTPDTHGHFRKPDLKFYFHLERTGFLPGEEINFKIRVSNPQRKSTDKRIVSLHKRRILTNDLSTKTGTAFVDRKTNTNPEFKDAGEVEYEDTLTVPLDAYPSTDDIIVKHCYFIRVEIITSDWDEPSLQKDIPVIIGTVNEEVES